MADQAKVLASVINGLTKYCKGSPHSNLDKVKDLLKTGVGLQQRQAAIFLNTFYPETKKESKHKKQNKPKKG